MSRHALFYKYEKAKNPLQMMTSWTLHAPHSKESKTAYSEKKLKAKLQTYTESRMTRRHC